ncbi:MAG: SurA N-terminal domain-containing protein [Pseudomonadota bacterium]
MESFRGFVQSWFGRLFLGGVLVVFVVTMFWTGAPTGSQGELVKVNGERIYKSELDQAVDAVMARFGDQLDRRMLEKLVSREAVLEDLIRQRAMIDAARDMGVIADPRAVHDTIQSIPAFQDEQGQFSQARFQQAILSNGFANAAGFRARVEQEIIAEQVKGAFSDSAFATRPALELLTRIGEQKRDLAWLVLSPADFTARVTIADAEVQARYDANPAGYMTEETFAVDYLEVKQEDYAANQQVDEAAVRSQYDALVQKANENAERRVAHILVASAGRSEADAKARADEILARLAKGETFAKLAAEYSDDKGSAASGGDLGYLGRDVLDPALTQALATLNVNDVSGAVKSPDGLHILKLLDINQVQVPSYESSRAEITASLKREQAKARYEEVVAELGALTYESDNLQDPAAKLGLKVQGTGPFGRNGGPGIAANRKVLEEILAPEVLEEGRNSGVIDVSEGHAVVVRLKEHHPAERRPFAEVSSQVRAELVREKAVALARDKAAGLKAALAGGQAIDDIAKTEKLAVQRAPAAQRAAQAVPREILQAAFSARRPAAGGVTAETVSLADGSQALLAVSNVIDGTLLGVTDAELLARRMQLAEEFGRYDYNRFVDSALASADIERAAADTGTAPVPAPLTN